MKNSKQTLTRNLAATLAALLLCFYMLPAMAQTTTEEGIRVRGTVVDAQSNPLPSLAVQLKGTSMGVTTNEQGEFEFSQRLQPGDVLVFSYISMENKEYIVKAGMPDKIRIVMEESPLEIIGATTSVEAYQRPSALRRWWNRITDR